MYSMDFFYEAIKSDPEDDQPSMAIVSNKSDGIDDIAHGKQGTKRQDIENLSIIQQEKGVRNLPHPSNSFQILKTDKYTFSNEKLEEINMKPGIDLNKNKGTLINYKRKFQETEDDKKCEEKSGKKRRNVANKQINQNLINNKYTQEENTKNPQISIINTITVEFQCNECHKQFSTKDILTDHIANCMKTAKTLEMYSCDICSYKTNRKLFIETHLNMHNVNKVFCCNICEYRCSNKNNLKQHIEKHTGEKPFSCNIGEYRFAQKQHLVRHSKTHTGEKPFSCNICEYRFSRKQHLKNHMRTHTGEKPFSCNICECRFSQKSALNQHIRTHTGVKPFSCNICEYRCSHKGDLIKHMRKHTGEKPYSCKICDFKCSRKNNLKDHTRTHTGDKPFSCNFCEYRSTRKYHLKSHLRKHV